MTINTYQALALSALVGEVECLTASGALPEASEERLRKLIAQTLSAFHMPDRNDRYNEAMAACADAIRSAPKRRQVKSLEEAL